MLEPSRLAGHLTLRVKTVARVLLLSAAVGTIACGKSDAEDDEPEADAGLPAVILDGGGGIEPPPDGASLCADGQCNYQEQTGCQPGEQCLPAATGDDRVDPSCWPAGSIERGEVCGQTGSADPNEWFACEAGHLCVPELDGSKRCRKLCCGGDWTACPSGESCIRQLQVEIKPNPPVNANVDLCFPVGNCEVFDEDSCADQPGRACQIVDPTGNVACAPIGDGTLGDPCSSIEPCSRGLSCVGKVCRRLCRAVLPEPGDDPPCPPAEGVCIHFDRDPPGVGECTAFVPAGDAGAE